MNPQMLAYLPLIMNIAGGLMGGAGQSQTQGLSPQTGSMAGLQLEKMQAFNPLQIALTRRLAGLFGVNPSGGQMTQQGLGQALRGSYNG